MYFKNKKGQIVNNVLLWFFACFIYFGFGYDIFKSISTDVFLSNNPTGLVLVLGSIAPFIPILGLMFWGYKIKEEVTGG